MRKPLRTNAPRKRVSEVQKVQAPVGGWDAVSALADMPPDRAVVLDNWFPTPSDVRVRRGHELWAHIGSTPIETVMPYNRTSGTGNLFAATSSSIKNITLGGTAGSTTGGFANGRWQYVNFTTSGGHYLFIVNGANAPRAYDGSTFTTPSITGITASTIINVNVHKQRLWFVIKDSTQVAYLDTAAIAGAVGTLELGPFLNKGGWIVAMATWTLDGGSGQDDLAVFMSSEGQAIVYQGTDPTSADTWSMIGVFDLGPPIGYRCFTKVGGDVALINIDGVLPLSKALHQDRGATPSIAITQRINNAMNEAAQSYSANFGWQLCPYPLGTMAILNVPIVENDTQYQYVMNTLTGAWCRFTGQNANCWAVWNDELYFGGNDGNVYKADSGNTDNGTAISAEGQTAYSYYGSQGGLKRWSLLQPLLTTSSTSFRPAVGVSTDFKDNATLGTPTSVSASGTFDSGAWDSATFGSSYQSSTDWTTVNGIGQCASIHFRSTTSSAGVWGSGLWSNAFWSADTTSDLIIRLNGFHAALQRGEGIM